MMTRIVIKMKPLRRHRWLPCWGDLLLLISCTFSLVRAAQVVSPLYIQPAVSSSSAVGENPDLYSFENAVDSVGSPAEYSAEQLLASRSNAGADHGSSAMTDGLSNAAVSASGYSDEIEPASSADWPVRSDAGQRLSSSPLYATPKEASVVIGSGTSPRRFPFAFNHSHLPQPAALSAVASAEDDESVCEDGLMMPAWRPLRNLSRADRFARGTVYFLSLVYLFVGVSIIADKFMAAIEVITSKEKDVLLKKPDGSTQLISVRIWNETVSNLTLMALGSSAPEILLSIIEVYAHDFNPGDLGPGTIVGSAAFNMFVIIAVCVWVVPCSEVKKIKHLRVYCVTMIWSVFAYLWLVVILSWVSRGVVEIWEGLLTFAFFPATVLTAYIADRRLLIYKYLNKDYRMNRRGVIVETEGIDQADLEMGPINKRKSSAFAGLRNSLAALTGGDAGLKVFEHEALNEEAKEFEQHRREYIAIVRELRKKHPDAPMETLEMMAREEIVNRGPKSRAFYRLQVC